MSHLIVHTILSAVVVATTLRGLIARLEPDLPSISQSDLLKL